MKLTDSAIMVIFSKDRAMQLNCCIDTLHKQCQDIDNIPVNVIYTTTNNDHERSYDILKENYPDINFIKENDFKKDLLDSLIGKTHVLFIVDDTIFVDEFYIGDMVDALEYKHNEYALGVSLRLGKNTTHCYPLNKDQKIPDFVYGWFGLSKFDWKKSEYDFNYPLELSSSLYRIDDLRSIFTLISYNNPNELEYLLSINSFMIKKNYLLCFDTSVAFSNPVNKVQKTNNNRCAIDHSYSSEFLLGLFLEGFRIDITAFENFISLGCHHEVEFLFINLKEKGK